MVLITPFFKELSCDCCQHFIDYTLKCDFVTARCYASMLYAVVMCLSVHLSQFGSSTKTAKLRIMQSMLYNSPGTLVFWCQRSWQNSNAVTPRLVDLPPCACPVSSAARDVAKIAGFAARPTAWALSCGELQADRLPVRWIQLLKHNL